MTPSPPLADWVDAVEPTLKKLRNLCSWYPVGVSLENSLRTFAQRFQEHEYTAFFRGLSISIAGFLYVDPDAKEVHYQFFGDASGQSEDINEAYMVGYQREGWAPWGQPEAPEQHNRYARSIDSLFLVHRTLQRNFQSPGSRVVPEYVKDLPIRDADTLITNLDEHIRQEFGIHYVPYGEMVAFMLMWRRLVRRIHGGNVAMWNLEAWAPSLSPYERLLAQTLAGAGLDKISNDSRADLGGTLAEYDDPDPDTGWKLDVRRLLLTPDQHAAWGEIPDHGRAPLQAFLGAAGFSEDFTEISEGFVDRLLSADIFVGLAPEVCDPTELTAALNRLHTISRFPILPYFYWSAISRRPRSHAVVPIWASITAPLKKPISTPVVGMAVIDLAPLEQLDPTYTPSQSVRYATADPAAPDGPGRSVGDQERVRLRHVCSALRLIAQPQIDKIYYGRIQDSNIRRDEIENIGSSLTHDAKNLVNPILNILRSDRPAEQKVLIATQLADELHSRLTRVARLAAYPALTGEELALQFENAKTTISVGDIIEAELRAALRRFLFNRASVATRFLRLFGLQGDGNNFDPEAVDFVTPKILLADDVESLIVPLTLDDSFSNYATALQLVFGEIFENFFKHQVAPRLSGGTPDNFKIEISVRARSAEAEIRELGDATGYALDVTFFPGEAERPERLIRWSGLTSLANAASQIGVKLSSVEILCGAQGAKPRMITLPFWSHATNDGAEPTAYVWTLEDLLLKKVAP